MTNQKFSLKGWSLKTWAIKNKDSLKLIVSGLAGLATVGLNSLSPTWSVALGGLVATGSKLVLDTIDYWQSE